MMDPLSDQHVEESHSESRPPTSSRIIENLEDEHHSTNSLVSSSANADFDSLDNDQYVKRHLYVDEILNMWNLKKIILELGTHEQCVAFAETESLIRTYKECRTHRKPMCLQKNGKMGTFICRRHSCRDKRKQYSRSKGTWFENIKISLPHVFYLMYCFAHGWSQYMVILEDPFKENQCLSPNTLADWNSYCRETIVTYQIKREDYVGKIGGAGKIVQIDKSKFGERKYSKDHNIEGRWVLGMIENDGEDLRLEIFPENSPSAESIVPLIQKHVTEGSIIHTDDWHAFDSLSDNGYVHYKVNHTYTQKIDNQWQSVKRFFNRDRRNHPDINSDILYEYLWRRNCLKHKKDPFIELINAVKFVYPPP